MKFKYIIIFSLNEFNKNKKKDGYSPQDGEVINCFINALTGLNCVAVGFK